MRNELTKATLPLLRDRFYEFADSKIYHVQLDLMLHPSQMRVIVAAPDWKNGPATIQNPYEPDILKITFEMEGLTQYVIKQADNYQLVLLSELEIGFFSHEVFLDFDPISSDTEHKHTYIKDNFNTPRVTQLFVACKKCYWTVDETPIQP
jgi:hypothetical protein